MSTNALADRIDPRKPSRVGFGTPGNVTAWVAFRRVLAPNGEAPDWIPHPTIVKKLIAGGTFARQITARDADTLDLDVEVSTTADAAILRSLVGTTGSLVLPGARYDADDYGTGKGYPDGVSYRTQTAFLAAISASVITTRQTTKLTLSFERDPQ